MSLGAGNSLRGLLNDLLALGEDHLDVARVGHVRVDLGRVVSLGVQIGEIQSGNVHDRGHGMCGGSAWGPG